jgi:hypothetical protein
VQSSQLSSIPVQYSTVWRQEQMDYLLVERNRRRRRLANRLRWGSDLGEVVRIGCFLPPGRSGRHGLLRR